MICERCGKQFEKRCNKTEWVFRYDSNIKFGEPLYRPPKLICDECARSFDRWDSGYNEN